jgi:hypothetical protein
MIDQALKKLRARDDVSTREAHVLESAVSTILDVAKNETFVRADVPLANSNILLEGLVPIS